MVNCHFTHLSKVKHIIKPFPIQFDKGHCQLLILFRFFHCKRNSKRRSCAMILLSDLQTILILRQFETFFGTLSNSVTDDDFSATITFWGMILNPLLHREGFTSIMQRARILQIIFNVCEQEYSESRYRFGLTIPRGTNRSMVMYKAFLSYPQFENYPKTLTEMDSLSYDKDTRTLRLQKQV